MFKEHLLDLNMNKTINKGFEELPTATKTSFTRAYNATHKDPTARKVGTGGKRAAKEESNEDVSDDDDNGLIDEEELAEIRKAKKADKEKAAALDAEKVKVDEFTMIKASLDDDEKGKGKKGKKTATTKAKKAPAKSQQNKKKKKNKDSDDDSLDGFIVSDDEDLGYNQKKKKHATAKR